MTKRDFIAIAAIFHNAMRQDIGAIGRQAVWTGTVLPFVEYAEKANPRFSRDTFLAAVAYPTPDEQTALGI